VKLIPFSSQFLRPDKPLPFGLRDQSGRLLLAAGERIETPQQYQLMREQPLFALEAESSEWLRKLQLAMEGMIRQGATLSQVASVEPDLEKREVAQAPPKTLPEQWQQLAGQLDTALRDTRPGSEGLARVRELRHRAKALLQRQPDAALYLSIYEAGHSTTKYSSHHGLLTMQICELAGPLLGWGADRVDTLCLAALSMNLGMHRLQDQLAAGDLDLTPSMRAQIDRHPQISADMLAAAGVDDALWLEVVRLHHDANGGEQPLAELPPARQLARLLRRVDIFTAKLSRRAKRVPMSPVQAAREACLGASGQPDEIGGALLKAVGLYPPGSFVELASGEVGIVVARGRRANLPLVGTLVGSTGAVLMQPILRDTTESRHAVKGAVASSAVNVRPQHDKLLALR
jgi:HD-GYP domain-containing protein (c-di-GMP phosphodiesterase class II)